MRKVTTGPADATNTAIVSGLAAGENVVIDGVDRLRDGAKVSVRNGRGARRRKVSAPAAPPPAGVGTAPGIGASRRPGAAGAPPAGGEPRAMIATRTGKRR